MAKMTFIKSAVKMKDFPVSKLREVALAGRSNAGKSSLINTWSGSKVAKVSQSPGKTRLLNFFNMNDSYIVVDMPGYGYASRGGDELKTWRKMIEGYLSQRPPLAGLVLLMDMARDWQEDEELLAQYVMRQDLPVVVVLTKADKFSKKDIEKAIQRIKQQSRIEDVFAISSTTRQGCDDLEDFIYRAWIKKK
jgi:GTP-binding protein